MKYKIFIIDDEPMIIKGLQKLVPWEEIQCEVCGSAKNGEEGFQEITKLQPDIVISDIRMPKLSGLQMIDQLREVKEDMKFIILTGYRDFDYARKALELGVVKYLLKPTNIEDIKSAVLEAMMMLDEERSKVEDIQLLREKIKSFKQSDVQIKELVKEQSGGVNSSTSDMIEKNQVGNNEKEEDGEHKIRYLAVQAIDFMKDHYQEKLDLQTVADNLFISTWYLCKVLKKEVDNSFVQLLNEIRISEAKRLLVETNYKIYEICEKVGYTDTPYFTKTFKKHIGMTPNQYRNKQY